MTVVTKGCQLEPMEESKEEGELELYISDGEV